MMLTTIFATIVTGPFLIDPPEAAAVRIATFNVSLNRETSGQLIRDLASSDDAQARNVAEIIQRVRPDILLLNEFDHDEESQAIALFARNYLARGQNGAEPIAFPFHFAGPVNTGVASGRDLDGDGEVATEPGVRGYGNDALGYGQFPGQYGMVVYSRYPIAADEPVRVLGDILWKDMPGALLPMREDGSSWYSDAALEILPLSSKNHWDVPIQVGEHVLHLLVSHPTPPAFDGPERRNQRRNHDEIRLWSDYLMGGEAAAYVGASLPASAAFVVMGDQNADPVDGGSYPGAIDQLLEHPRIQRGVLPTSFGAVEGSRLQAGTNEQHRGDHAADTADFDDERVGNLRVDYVLPSTNLRVIASGVFWPQNDDPLHRLVAMEPKVASSDHRMVYIDVEFEDLPSPN